MLTDDIAGHLTGDIDMIFLCDPWNPVGKNIKKDTLEKILSRASELDITVVLDRSFYMISDAYPEDYKTSSNGSADLVKRFDNLYIVASLTKCFALPGIRMGYAISRPENVKMLKNQLPEWNLGCLENACIGRLLRLAEQGTFFADSIDLIKKERRFLTDSLSDMGFKVFESDTDFILVKRPDVYQKDIHEKLLGRGIMIRKCDDLYGLGEDFYRIAVRDHDDNVRLIRALSDINYVN